jgi:hypothetical protein
MTETRLSPGAPVSVSVLGLQAMQGAAGACRPLVMCAEHVQQLGGASPLSNLMVVKD